MKGARRRLIVVLVISCGILSVAVFHWSDIGTSEFPLALD
jgi:hypothetical protein